VLYAPPLVEDFPTDTVSAILDYYSDKKLHNKRGSIDLTTCEEVYSALDSETYKHVFCVQVIYFDVLSLFSLFFMLPALSAFGSAIEEL